MAGRQGRKLHCTNSFPSQYEEKNILKVIYNVHLIILACILSVNIDYELKRS